MRVAFVVQRYGEEVAGGAEALCRATAGALAAAGDAVEVFTTTARDYLTWAPHYPEGTTREDGVTVHRFAADAPDPARADRLGKALALAPGDDDAEREWARAQGPVAPGLIRALAAAVGPGGRVEAAAAWTYLYATSQLAMPLAPARTLLVPLAHDEPMLRFGLSRGLVRSAGGIAYMTPEERRLVEDLLGPLTRPAAVVGAGIAPAVGGDAARARARFDLPRRFALYLGRIDPAKGVGALVRAHDAYRRAGGSYGLVLAGRPTVDMGLPGWVRTTGFVDARARADLLAAAELVVLPSPHESLSLVALEAWSAGRATLATARSEVLAGQTARSSGGLLYVDDLSYARQMSRLAADPSLRDVLGTRGARFAREWTWDACVRRWRALLAQVRAPVGAAAVRG
ncbi:MAG TPA: glycosyltransferase family 4 protein [Miltoncostaeaceae bacterium]|nr:glycosyltransferase family 4 protein [Miltoncostaeaceae bacterium]